MAKTAQEIIQEANGGRLYEYYDENGEKIGSGPLGKGVNPESMVGKNITPSSDGKLWTPYNVDNITANIKLDTTTGNIKISAPKSMTDTSEFKKVFDEDQLKKYSQAYKLNPDYKVSITEKNEETGEEEEKEVTIPEYIEKLNESMDNFVENYKSSFKMREKLSEQYGNKAGNMSISQIQMAFGDNATGTYLPEILFNVNFFGDDPKKGNAFKQLQAKLGENGSITIDDLKKVFTRDEFGRSELAGVLATINGALKGSDWSSETFYKDEEGNDVYNKSSANEAAKLLAFKNYLLNNTPEGNWLQETGGNIETFMYNAAYGTTRVFGNTLNFVSGGSLQENIKDMDETMEFYVQTKSMESEATQTLATLGMLGGSLLGAVGVGKLTGGVVSLIGKGVGAATSWATGVAYAKAGFTTTESVLKSGVSVKQAIDIAANAGNISKGAAFMFKFVPAAQKVGILRTTASAWMNAHSTLNFASKFLLDTMTDAIMFDSTTLFDTLKATDQETRDFWMGQLVENGKWWGGMALGKGMLKLSGKTTLGKAANALITPVINKIAAAIGDKKASIKDKIAGGDYIEKLKDQRAKAREAGKTRKANRLAEKISQAEWNNLLRDARKQLGDIKLDWDGVKLTEESAEEFRDAMTRVKALENGIDAYARNIQFKRSEMVGYQIDPATGKKSLFINPTLGKANVKASTFYFDVADKAKKLGLKSAPDSLVSQDVIDYMVGLQHERIMLGFSKYGTPENRAAAENALVTIRKNLEMYKSELPDELVKFIDKGIKKDKVYQKWYKAQNEYGMSKGLLDKEKISSYEANDIWKEAGYMPIVVQTDVKGHWVEDSGRIDAVIEQDFQNFSKDFKVAEGQHYVDPELVRQSRLSNMAKAEVNINLYKAYSGFGSNATNITRISGEETQYVQKINDNIKSLDNAVKMYSEGSFKGLDVELTKQYKKKMSKNTPLSKETMTTVVASMAPDDVTNFLVRHKVLPNRNTKLTDGVTKDNYKEWWESRTPSEKKYLEQQYAEVTTKKKMSPNFTDLQKAMDRGGADFEAGLQRARLIDNDGFAKSSVAQQAAKNLEDGKDAFYQGVFLAKIKGELRNIPGKNTDELVDDLYNTLRWKTEDYVENVVSDVGARKVMDTLAESSNGTEDVARYIALKQLQQSGMDNVYKVIDSEIDIMVKNHKIDHNEVDLIKKKTKEMADEIVNTELDSAASSARTINPDLVDAKDIYAKQKKLADDITGAKKDLDQDFIMYLDDEGRQVYAQVDPAFASLFNYRYKMDKSEASVLAKANAVMSKVFRYGTTSVNLSSFGNQMFRDFGNAIMVGGAWQTIKSNADNLVDVFGNRIVDQIKNFDPDGYEMKQLKELAKDTGQTLEEAAVSRELMRGSAISPTTTERTLYKDLMKNLKKGDTETVLTNAQTKLQEIVNKWNPEDLLNGKRENYLRNRVFASSYNDAMNAGYTVEQSRIYAEFAMNNATTNFSRQLYHLQAIADSTPYFRAAINGTKSFWRMWSLDPVGITGRITGGLILPVMFLTGASLGSEENKKVYKNIPEYQKEDNLVFVINGQAMSIPIPQELSSVVNPFRQFVEYLNDANENDFWELMMNDALGFFPYDFQGFTTIDMDKMIQDPTVFDRMGRGFSRLFSQMAPVPLKSTYMLATGIDPYSGKNLRDPSYTYWNQDTESLEVMDYDQSEFAKLFAKMFPGTSPYLAEKVISGIFGATGSHILSDISALVVEGGESALETTMGNIGSQVMKPFEIAEYDMVDAVWKRAVRDLTAEKEAIINSDAAKTSNAEISQEKDPEKRKKLLAERQNLVNDYEQKVKSMVERLDSVYNGSFDRKKFAAVVQLLNFDSDAGWQTGSQYSSDLASDQYWDGRDAAIHTMQQMGIKGTEDMSIFGYVTKDRAGNPRVKYSSPVAIMDMKNQWDNQADFHLANIKAIISSNDLWDKKDEVKAQVEAIYDKKKLSSSDYDQIDAIYVNWNAEVMSAIAPYVERMTPEAAINNQEVLDYLDGLMEVPGDYKKDKYGRYVTNTKLGNGSAKDAYIKNYIRNVFKVNNTGYESGKNYSNRG